MKGNNSMVKIFLPPKVRPERHVDDSIKFGVGFAGSLPPFCPRQFVICPKVSRLVYGETTALH
jgi:hypothetical protein